MTSRCRGTESPTATVAVGDRAAVVGVGVGHHAPAGQFDVPGQGHHPPPTARCEVEEAHFHWMTDRVYQYGQCTNTSWRESSMGLSNGASSFAASLNHFCKQIKGFMIPPNDRFCLFFEAVLLR